MKLMPPPSPFPVLTGKTNPLSVGLGFRKCFASFTCTLLVLSPVLAQADLIGFTEFPPGTVIGSQYPTAIFSSIPGEEVRVANDYNFGANSAPNYILTALAGGQLDGLNGINISFTAPVSGLTFLALGDNAAGAPGHVDVYNGLTLLGTVPIVVDGLFNTPELVDLTSFGSITRIAISANTDPGGLAYDTFSFTVPEPATTSLMLLGAGLLYLRRKR